MSNQNLPLITAIELDQIEDSSFKYFTKCIIAHITEMCLQHIDHSAPGTRYWAAPVARPHLTSLLILSPVQDALFFLKDFFSNLASFVNPYLPVDPATEG